MSQGVAFFAAEASAFAGPLDSYTTNLWSALSISRLLTAWTGGAVEVRESAGSTLATIGFIANGSLDTATLLSHVGANNGLVRTFINQQGTSARGVEQSTDNTRQPAIATAGAYLGDIQFDGSNDMLNGGTASGTPSAFTVFCRGKLRSTTGTQIILEHSSNYNSNDAAVAYYDAGALSVGVHKITAVGYSRSDFTGDFPNYNVHCWRFDRAQVTSAAMTKLFINGTADTRDANGDSGTLPSGNFAANNWYVGARVGPAIPAFLNLHTLLIYEGAVSDADVAAISTIIAALP